MIEFRKNEDDSYELIHNGKKIVDIEITPHFSAFRNEWYFYVNASRRDIGEQLIQLLEYEDDNIPGFTELVVKDWGRLDGSQVKLTYNYANDDFNFNIFYDLESWNFSFSFEDYYVEFSRIFGTGYFAINQKDIKNYVELELSAIYSNLNYTLYDEILRAYQLIEKFHSEALERVLKTSENEINAIFNFPEDLKVSCEQYLLYFAQFLQDLGINATSNLKEEAGKVLFSVAPTDDFEALDKIREALAIYLSLASNPIPNSTGDRMVDMVLSGARANAKHLESQLELAIAKLQFKEATLELKDATIEQHQLALRQKNETIKELQEIVSRGNIFEESLEKVEINGEVIEETSLYRFNREDDIEIEATPVLDEKNEETRVGLVKFHEVTKLKDYGVTLDLPKAIRNLIDYFKRDKNND